MNWKWLEKDTVLAIHDQQIAEHGGAPGIRSMELLESALGRPLQMAAYASPNVFDLAASYAWGIARNHPFLDGNKRTAFVSCLLFLRLHGLRVASEATRKALLFVRLGEGSISQEDLAKWLESKATAILA